MTIARTRSPPAINPRTHVRLLLLLLLLLLPPAIGFDFGVIDAEPSPNWGGSKERLTSTATMLQE